jgi:hypothetical protein
VRETYLLPCQCGQRIPVEATQSGQEVTCPCGRRLEVPTMRKLSTLERTRRPERTRPPSTSWGARQAVFLLGVIITLAGLAFAAYLYLKRPQIPPVVDLNPRQTWIVWQQEIRPGLTQPPPWEGQYLAGVKTYRVLLGTAGSVAALGTLVIFSSLLIPRRRPLRAKRPGRRRPPP